MDGPKLKSVFDKGWVLKVSNSIFRSIPPLQRGLLVETCKVDNFRIIESILGTETEFRLT